MEKLKRDNKLELTFIVFQFRLYVRAILALRQQNPRHPRYSIINIVFQTLC